MPSLDEQNLPETDRLLQSGTLRELLLDDQTSSEVQACLQTSLSTRRGYKATVDWAGQDVPAYA